MPWKHPCPAPGCKKTLERGQRFCPEHAAASSSKDRRRRGSARARGYTRDWEKLRATHLHEHPLCVLCEKRGLIVPASVVDHIIAHKGDPTLLLDSGNLRSLCKPCHDAIVHEGDFGRLPVRPEDLEPSRVPVAIVCGPPGVGKSRYVDARAGRADLVLDLDQIKARLSGLDLYQAPDHFLGPALQWRNNRLRELGRAIRWEMAYLIVTAPLHTDRRWWKEKLGPKASTVLLLAPIEVCIARIEADRRRREKAAHVHFVREWFASYVEDPDDVIVRT